MPKLEPGNQAPPFALPDADGQVVSLSDFLGKRVIVYFYPKDSTPGCTKEACQFNESLSEFKRAGIEVIGISPDSGESHRRFAEKYGLTLRLLSDPTREVMKAYGAFGPKSMYGRQTEGVIRSTFLVGPDGKVEKLWYNVKADGHASKVLEAALSSG
ncbi:MAG: thioredoxin-dependent thiol peroxidase [Actinobacteria bacterium]|jgi:peroxiredoxin Q/BCP|nr:thioredoxin-dependent thiol peroxidase [Actinomycetota bacterium]MCL6095215.1 thioredoxin-dependent thiol peroxidase [Actinomycetota bacterium]